MAQTGFIQSPDRTEFLLGFLKSKKVFSDKLRLLVMNRIRNLKVYTHYTSVPLISRVGRWFGLLLKSRFSFLVLLV